MNSNIIFDFKNEYIEWLRRNTEQITLTDGITRLTTPLLDSYNDFIEIYIFRDNDKYILCDNGETISDLEMSNFPLKEGTKKSKIFNTILNSFGVKLDGENDNLYINCTKENFAIKANSFMQCLIKVSDMILLADSNIKSIFSELVQEYFDNNGILYTPNINIIGKSTMTANYDFVIPKSKHYPERFIKPINNVNETMVKSTIFTWEDVKPVRSDDSVLYAILNDTQKQINTESITALKEYKIKTILWSQRKQFVSELSAS